VTDYSDRIADAAGDAGALLRLAIELATAHAAAEGKLAALEQAETARKRGQAERQQRRRGKVSRDVTLHNVTGRDVTEPAVTDRDVTLPPRSEVPPDPLLTHTPATHTPSRAREEDRGRAAVIARQRLNEQLGAEGLGVVDEYLDTIRTQNRDGWHIALLRMIGPATGILAEDLVAGLRDAMLVEPIVKQPGPLATFVQFRKRERQREAAETSAAQSGGTLQIVSGRGGGKTDRAERAMASALFGEIRAAIEERQVIGQGTRRVLPLAKVDALGERARRAYTNVGGAERFLNMPADKLGILLSQFTDAYLATASSDNPPTERKEA
jgi:hypothetical protein